GQCKVLNPLGCCRTHLLCSSLRFCRSDSVSFTKFLKISVLPRRALSRGATDAATAARRSWSTHAADGSLPHWFDRTCSARGAAPAPAQRAAALPDVSTPRVAPFQGSRRCPQPPAPRAPDSSKCPAGAVPLLH